MAIRHAGFAVTKFAELADNPIYNVKYSDHVPFIRVFSKRYDHLMNPTKNFAAVMTCAGEHHSVAGASATIAVTYDDPREFDGTPEESMKHDERVLEIGREILYAFSRINTSH
jgi:hypothetical protein